MIGVYELYPIFFCICLRFPNFSNLKQNKQMKEEVINNSWLRGSFIKKEN